MEAGVPMTGPVSRHDFVVRPHFHWRMGVDSRSLVPDRYNRSRLIKDIQNPKSGGKVLSTNCISTAKRTSRLSYARLKNRSQRKDSPRAGDGHELDST